MLEYFSKALGQLTDPRLRKILLFSVLTALGLVLVAIILIRWALSAVPDTGVGFLDWILSHLLDLGALFFGFFLFPLLLTTSQSFFAEGIARAVEARHYPDLPKGRDQPVREAIGDALRFLGVTIGLNILVLPLYFVPVVNFFIFYLLNGYLVGREYFEVVAVRRLDTRGTRALRLSNRGTILIMGMVLVLLSMIPVANLLAPVIGTAAMLHLFERLRRGQSTQPAISS